MTTDLAQPKIEIPDAPARYVPIPAEPIISRDIAVPPAAFDADPEPGSFAHALMQPDKDVARIVVKYFTKPRDPWFSEWNSASEVGDPCIRKIAYQRLMPEKALPDDDELTMIFRHGHWMEKEAYAELADAGYEVVEQQRTYVDRELMIKGKIDGKLVLTIDGQRRKPAFDIKGYAPGIWDQIDSAKDLLDAGRPYLRKVPGQITLYMVLDKENAESNRAGLLYLKNKVTGKPKQIVVPFVQSYVDWLIRRVRMINDYVARKELPARIEYSEEECGSCPFRHLCLGEMPPGAVNPVVLDPDRQKELHGLLDDWTRLSPLAKEFKEIDRRVSKILQGHPKVIIGDFIATGGWIDQSRFDSESVPDDIKKKFTKKNTYWKKDIVNVRSPRKRDLMP